MQVPLMVALFLFLGAVAAPAAWTLGGVGATANDVISQACDMMALHTREPDPVKNQWVETSLRCEELAKVCLTEFVRRSEFVSAMLAGSAWVLAVPQRLQRSCADEYAGCGVLCLHASSRCASHI